MKQSFLQVCSTVRFDWRVEMKDGAKSAAVVRLLWLSCTDYCQFVDEFPAALATNCGEL